MSILLILLTLLRNLDIQHWDRLLEHMDETFEVWVLCLAFVFAASLREVEPCRLTLARL